MDAAKIADIKVLKLMNETTAIALEYGILRRTELTSTARVVMFIDFGYSKTSICLGSLQNKSGKIITEFHDRNLGVRDMDWILYEYYCKMLEEKCDEDPRNNKKVRIRILQGLEKQRKKLSSDDEGTINLEYLFMDEDLYHTIKLKDYLKLVAPVLKKFEALIRKSYNYLKGKKYKLHSVEIVGGGSRIPII